MRHTVFYDRGQREFDKKSNAKKFAHHMLGRLDHHNDMIVIAGFRKDGTKSYSEEYRLVSNITKRKGIFYTFKKVGTS